MAAAPSLPKDDGDAMSDGPQALTDEESDVEYGHGGGGGVHAMQETSSTI